MIAFILALTLASQVSTATVTTPRQFGAKNDFMTDDWEAFARMEEKVCTGSASPLVELRGKYILSKTLAIQCPMHVRGQLGFLGVTLLQFPARTEGVRLLPASRFSTFEHVQVHATMRQDDSDFGIPGIRVQAVGVSIEHVKVNDFAGDGIMLDCRLSSGTNCNAVNVRAIRSEQNKGFGFSTNGPDSNGGSFDAMDLSDNSKGCIKEGSFLGNAYRGGHCDGGPIAVMQTDPNSATTIEGLYCEGWPEVHFESVSATLFGGNCGNVTGRGGRANMGKISGFKWEGKLPLDAPKSGAKMLSFTGYSSPLPLEFGYELNGEPFVYEWAIGGAGRVMKIANFGHPEVAPGTPIFDSYIAIGTPGNRRTIGMAQTVPPKAKGGGFANVNTQANTLSDCALYVTLRDGTQGCVPFRPTAP